MPIRRTFVETIGTVFYGRRRPQETIIECLALLAERNSLAAIETISNRGQHHAEPVYAVPL
jgi:hypothetical protein